MIWGPYDLILNKQGFAAEREKSKKNICIYQSVKNFVQMTL